MGPFNHDNRLAGFSVGCFQIFMPASSVSSLNVKTELLSNKICFVT